MAIISTDQFLAIADRLAAQYSMLTSTLQTVNGGSTAATLTVGASDHASATVLGNDKTSLLVEAKTAGIDGNDLSIFIVNGGNSQSLSFGYFLDDLIVYAATDVSGNITTPLSTVYNWLSGHPTVQNKVSVKGVSINPAYVTDPNPFIILLGGESDTFNPSVQNVLAQSILSGSTPFFGGDSEDSYTLTATTLGYLGNEVNVTLTAPTQASQPLNIAVSGSAITVTLATDQYTNVSTSAAELVAALNSNSLASKLLTASIPDGGHGTANVDPLTTTYLSGGRTGSYENVVLTCSNGLANPELVSAMATTAANLDDNLTIANITASGVGWLNLITSLQSHFSLAGQANLTQGYLTANNLLVHRDFATLFLNSTGTSLNSVNVFRPDSLSMGTITLTSGIPVLSGTASLGTGDSLVSTTNYAPQTLQVTLTPSTEAATRTILTGTSGLIFTAKDQTKEGNNLQIEYTNAPSYPNSLSVNYLRFNPLTGKRKISVVLGRDGTGTVTTTAAALKALIDADPICSAVVDVDLVSDGSGLLSAVAATSLTGGLGPDLNADLNLSVTLVLNSAQNTVVVDQIRWDAGAWPNSSQVIAQKAKLTANAQLRFVARNHGTGGNQIKVTITNPGTPNAALAITVSGNNINISLATNGSSVATTTATTLVTALRANTAVMGLVWVDLLVNGSTVISTLSQTALSGGAAPPKALSVSAVAIDSLNLGVGTEGDVVKVDQIVERQISL